MLTEKQEKLLQKYNIDKNKIYLRKNNFFYKYIYIDMNELLIVDITDIREDYFKIFDIKNMIKTKKEYIKKLLEKKDYKSIFFLIDKPYKLSSYIKNFYNIPDEDKYKIFIDIYTSMEYGFNDISELFLDNIIKYKPHKEFTELPEEIIIYRGEGKKSTKKEQALSWTTNKDIAIFFANRFNDKGKIYKAKVKRKDIIDYINNRGENEILVKYKYLYNIEKIQ